MPEGPLLCAICDDPATFYCSADDALLCDDCDKQVHEANFFG
jgi:hypothetical protein